MCTCRICWDLVNDKEASSSFPALKCSQCDRKCNSSPRNSFVIHCWLVIFMIVMSVVIVVFVIGATKKKKHVFVNACGGLGNLNLANWSCK